jgi:hypothetical protein
MYVRFDIHARVTQSLCFLSSALFDLRVTLLLQTVMAGQNTAESRKLALQAPVSFLYQPPPTLYVQAEREEREKRESQIYGPKVGGGPQTEREKLIEKFPFLANAPQEGKFTENMAVQLKPFGKEVRHVRCLRCGQWGHQAGEKICELNDVAHPGDRLNKQLLDPMVRGCF